MPAEGAAGGIREGQGVKDGRGRRKRNKGYKGVLEGWFWVLKDTQDGGKEIEKGIKECSEDGKEG